MPRTSQVQSAHKHCCGAGCLTDCYLCPYFSTQVPMNRGPAGKKEPVDVTGSAASLPPPHRGPGIVEPTPSRKPGRCPVSARCLHGAQALASSAGVGNQYPRWLWAGEGLELSGEAKSAEIRSRGDNLRTLLEAAIPGSGGRAVLISRPCFQNVAGASLTCPLVHSQKCIGACGCCGAAENKPTLPSSTVQSHLTVGGHGQCTQGDEPTERR